MPRSRYIAVLSEIDVDPRHAGRAPRSRRDLRPDAAPARDSQELPSYRTLPLRVRGGRTGGAALAGCLHNTGEGGVSPYHRQGGNLVWQIGTGYFGCRGEDGGFSLERFRDTVPATASLRAIEVKLSQGAKPGLCGVLPGAKVTREIATMSSIPQGRTSGTAR